MVASKGRAKPRLVKGQVGLARALAVGLRTVQLWQKEGAPGPVASNCGKASGMYDVDAWQCWMADRKPKRAHERSESQADCIAREEGERRLTVAKAIREERRNQVEAGEYVPVSRVAEAVNRVARMFVGALERCGPELSVQLAGVDPRAMRSVIDRWVYSVRTELANAVRAAKRQGLPTENMGSVGVTG